MIWIYEIHNLNTIEWNGKNKNKKIKINNQNLQLQRLPAISELAKSFKDMQFAWCNLHVKWKKKTKLLNCVQLWKRENKNEIKFRIYIYYKCKLKINFCTSHRFWHRNSQLLTIFHSTNNSNHLNVKNKNLFPINSNNRFPCHACNASWKKKC